MNLYRLTRNTMRAQSPISVLLLSICIAIGFATSLAWAQEDAAALKLKADKAAYAAKVKSQEKIDAASAATKDYVELKLDLPRPVFKGTPTKVPRGTTVDPITLGVPRGRFFVPKGVKLLSLDQEVTGSDEEPIIGDLELVTDDDKEAADGSYVELGPGLQYVQIDLGEPKNIFAIVLWHYHADPRIYHDVVVQVADDADFISNVRTVYNNDHDNSAGKGVGKAREYFEASEGKLVNCKGKKDKRTHARYFRAYSNGNTADDQNHYVEIEVWGK